MWSSINFNDILRAFAPNLFVPSPWSFSVQLTWSRTGMWIQYTFSLAPENVNIANEIGFGRLHTFGGSDQPSLSFSPNNFSISADLQRTRLGSNKYSTPIEAGQTGLLSQQARMKGNVRFYLTFFRQHKRKNESVCFRWKARNKVVFKLIQIQIQIHFSTKEIVFWPDEKGGKPHALAGKKGKTEKEHSLEETHILGRSLRAWKRRDGGKCVGTWAVWMTVDFSLELELSTAGCSLTRLNSLPWLLQCKLVLCRTAFVSLQWFEWFWMSLADLIAACHEVTRLN